MATVNDIFGALDRMAPFDTQMSFDNAGFLVGHSETQVDCILVALDITPQVVAEAKEMEAQLIVAHHPIIFNPVKSVTDQTVTGQILLALVESGIAAICAHTNLDSAQGGVNDCLAQALGLSQTTLLEEAGIDCQGRPYGIGRVGTAHETGLTPQQYAIHVGEALHTGGVRYTPGNRPISRVAVGGGSCGSMLHCAVQQGCDAFVTGDVKHDVFLEANALGITLIDGGHQATEQVVCPMLVEYLATQFPGVQVARAKADGAAICGL